MNEFQRRVQAAAQRAPIWGSQRRRENIAMACQGATVPDMRDWMADIQGVSIPKSAKRSEVVAQVMAVMAG